MIVAAAKEDAAIETTESPEKAVEHTQKRRIGEGYTKRPVHSKRMKLDLSVQVQTYLNTDLQTENCNPFIFWLDFKNCPNIARLTRRVLIVPATSAPIERVFSHGGIIMRPHRASLGDKNLSDILFLKCNRK